MLIACVGGGSNAMGLFYDFIDEPGVALVGCEAAGHGVDTDKNAATIATGSLGIFHGMKSYFCQDEYGRSLRSTPSPQGWIIRESGRNTLPCTTPAGLSTSPSPTMRQ